MLTISFPGCATSRLRLYLYETGRFLDEVIMNLAIRRSLVLFSAFISIAPPLLADEVTIELKFRDPAWSGIVTFDDATGQPFRLNTKLSVYTITSMDIAYRGVQTLADVSRRALKRCRSPVTP